MAVKHYKVKSFKMKIDGTEVKGAKVDDIGFVDVLIDDINKKYPKPERTTIEFTVQTPFHDSDFWEWAEKHVGVNPSSYHKSFLDQLSSSSNPKERKMEALKALIAHPATNHNEKENARMRLKEMETKYE